jgi:hypothetical protein
MYHDMSQSGLQDGLEKVRTYLESEWKRQAARRAKYGPVDEISRRRRSELTSEFLKTAEIAVGLPRREEKVEY